MDLEPTTTPSVLIRLVGGEKDGEDFPMPADWDVGDPPLHTWVITALGERELRDYRESHRGKEPPGRRAALRTCAYRFIDDAIDDDGEVVALFYERDISADITPDCRPCSPGHVDPQ